MRQSKPKESNWVFTAILLSVLALGFGALLLERSRDRDRHLLEYTRLAMERDRMERDFDLKEAQYWESKEQRIQSREQQRFNSEEYRRVRERAEWERWQDKVEAQVRATERENRVYVAGVVFSRSADDIARQNEYRDRQVALAENERQNRWVRQRELEDERVRHERHYRLRAEETQERFERARDEYLRQRARGL